MILRNKERTKIPIREGEKTSYKGKEDNEFTWIWGSDIEIGRSKEQNTRKIHLESKHTESVNKDVSIKCLNTQMNVIRLKHGNKGENR